MRLIYVDEAGTSGNESIAVVIGIIVHPDTQYIPVKNYINGLIKQTVPAKFLPGFVFHAAEIWSKKKYREEWGDLSVDFRSS